MPRTPERTAHRQERVMGTVVTIDIYGDRSPRGAVEMSRACALLHRYDAIFSLWKPNSPLSRLRRGEIGFDEAPREVAQVLALCHQARDLTDGWFDALAMPGGFDPTGLVKGLAAQSALDLLVAEGCAACLVNAGGDIATCAGQEDPPWRIGIRHPASAQHLAAVIEVHGSVATSAEYERGPHLYDPVRGRHGSRLLSATVTGPDLGMADAMATALAVAGVDGLGFVERAAGYEGLAITGEGRAVATSGMRVLQMPKDCGLEYYAWTAGQAAISESAWRTEESMWLAGSTFDAQATSAENQTCCSN